MIALARCAVLAAALAAVFPAFAQSGDGIEPLVIKTEQISGFEARDRTRVRFGKLDFRGGLRMTSANSDFGGLSGLSLDAAGINFLTHSDKGRWFSGRLVYRDSRLVDIADAQTAPMLAQDGRPITARGWYDSEALAAAEGGILYVALERVHQILRFDFGKEGLRARGTPIAVPPEMKSLNRNQGIEGLVVPRKGMPLAGSIIALAERNGEKRESNIPGFVIKDGKFDYFWVKRDDDFDISDAAITPQGNLLILERRFSIMRGVAMRIRSVPLTAVKPNAILDGTDLIYADLGYEIDNMEGLAVHVNAAGETILTLVSDDNFLPIQRTIMLQFALVD